MGQDADGNTAFCEQARRFKANLAGGGYEDHVVLHRVQDNVSVHTDISANLRQSSSRRRAPLGVADVVAGGELAEGEVDPATNYNVRTPTRPSPNIPVRKCKVAGVAGGRADHARGRVRRPRRWVAACSGRG